MKNILFLALLWCLWYLAFVTRIIAAPILPLLESELALNHTMAGSLYLYNSFGAAIACLLVGKLSVIFGAKRLVVSGFLTAASASVGIYSAHTYSTIAVMLFIIGFGGGFYLPSAIPILTSVFAEKNWGKAISIHETAPGFCVLTVPITVVFALKMAEWRVLFLFFATSIIIAILLFWLLTPRSETDKVNNTSLGTIFRRLEFWIILILWGNASMTSLGVYNILPLYLVNERAMEMSYANQLFGMSRLGGLIGLIAMGFLLDHFSARRIMLILLIGSGLSTVGIALIHTHWIFIAMLVLQGTFGVVFFPVGIMATSRVAAMHERSAYTGMFMAVSQVAGIGATPFLLGMIADIWSFQIGLVILGAATLSLCPLVRLLKTI